MAEHIDTLALPLTYTLIAGGHSNLTYSVTDTAGGHWVLRRPPLGQVLATAHDMAREHTIISALGRPTCRCLRWSASAPTNPSTTRCSYVMDSVDGVVVRDESIASDLTPASPRRQLPHRGLHTIHTVDIDAVGLGDLGRKEDYLTRQLKRWNRQYEQSCTQVDEGTLPDLGTLHDLLAQSVPPQQRSSIVHGDYRLDNTMLGSDGSVVAVLVGKSARWATRWPISAC